MTVIGISEFGGKSPVCGVKTTAMPLLFCKKNFCSFSNAFVCVKVLPETELNFWVYSCSSDKIGLVLLSSPFYEAFVLVVFENLIVFFLPICWFSSSSCFSSSFLRKASASKAFATSDFFTGATWELGSNISDPNLNVVLMPERFLRINF